MTQPVEVGERRRCRYESALGKDIKFAFCSPIADGSETAIQRPGSPLHMPRSPEKEPIEPQEPENPGETEIDEDDAQLEEPEDDAFDDEESDTGNVSE